MRLPVPTVSMSNNALEILQTMVKGFQFMQGAWKPNAVATPKMKATMVSAIECNKGLADSVVFGTQLKSLIQQDGSWLEKKVPMVGYSSDAFDHELYASDEIKSNLVNSHRGCCAYCESYLRHLTHGDVEHFRPKAAYSDRSVEKGLNYEAYFWLAYHPANLLLACPTCNERYKGNEFPLLTVDRAKPGTDCSDEKPVLINPYVEDPRQFIRFNPLNGYAYPFDLVCGFYKDWKGASPEQVEDLIWKNPAGIPGQKFLNGEQSTNSEIEGAYQKYLGKAKHPILSRGIRTIGIFGLNRRELIYSRVGHLRHLRCLFWTLFLGQGKQNPELTNPKKVIDIILDPKGGALAPQYHSLSIDALQTWIKMAEGGSDLRVAQQSQNSVDVQISSVVVWLGLYNNYLGDFKHWEKDKETSPSAYNDSIMYYIPTKYFDKAGIRFLAYVSDTSAYGGDEAEGIFTCVDWETEGDCDVQIDRNGKKQNLKLKDFLDFDRKGLWRRFQGAVIAVASKEFTAIKDL